MLKSNPCIMIISGTGGLLTVPGKNLIINLEICQHYLVKRQQESKEDKVIRKIMEELEDMADSE